MILAEWSVTPEYLDREWTEEELFAMLTMRNRRIRRQKKPAEEKQQIRRISDKEMFASMGVVPKVVRVH